MMTSKTPSEPLDCESTLVELPALLSDELDRPMKHRVEAHLTTCSACRDELEGHRRTLGHLKAWTVESPAGEIHKRSVRRRRPAAWYRPAMAGVAAALLAFVVLGAVGADAKWADGQLTLTLGRLADDQSRSEPATAEPWAPAIREAVDELFDDRMAELLVALEEDLANFDQRHEQRRLILAGAVDRQRNTDWQRVKTAMEVLFVRQDAMTHWMTEFAPLEAPGNLDDRKEQS